MTVTITVTVNPTATRPKSVRRKMDASVPGLKRIKIRPEMCDFARMAMRPSECKASRAAVSPCLPAGLSERSGWSRNRTGDTIHMAFYRSRLVSFSVTWSLTEMVLLRHATTWLPNSLATTVLITGSAFKNRMELGAESPRESESTPQEHAERSSNFVAEQTLLEEHFDGSGNSHRFDAWVPRFLKDRYPNSKTVTRYLNAWSALATYLEHKKIISPARSPTNSALITHNSAPMRRRSLCAPGRGIRPSPS